MSGWGILCVTSLRHSHPQLPRTVAIYTDRASSVQSADELVANKILDPQPSGQFRLGVAQISHSGARFAFTRSTGP